MRVLSSIKPGEIHDLAKRLKPDAKASTRNRHVIVPCRAVINYAAERGLCPHIRVKGFREAKVIRKAVDREWIDKFMAHAPHRHLGLMALFMFTTGARISEAIRLTPDDVDLVGLKATLGKTENGNPRVYHLTRELADEMHSLPPKRVKDGSWRVFGYMTPGAPQEAWENTVKRARLPYASRHEAGRHSFATEMIVRRGQDVKTTADLGGWEDPTLLMRRYVHSEKLDDVAERVFGRDNGQASATKVAHPSNLKVVGVKK
jgi:integrase